MAVDVWYLVNIIGEVVIAVTSIVGNSVVIIVICKNSGLQTVTNYFVASLALADLLVGSVGIPAALIAFHGVPPNYFGCLLLNSLTVVFTQASEFGLLVIAVERFIAIKYPFFYTEHFNGRVAAILIIITWMASLLIGTIPVGWNTGVREINTCSFVAVYSFEYLVYSNFFMCSLFPLLIMFIIYCYIFHIVRKQIRQIAALQVQSPGQEPNVSSNFKKDLKAAKWFAVVIALFTVCWLPIHIMNTVTLLAGQTCLQCVIAAVLFSHLNSAINPVLYAYGNSKIKLAVKGLLTCKELVSSQEGVPTVFATNVSLQ